MKLDKLLTGVGLGIVAGMLLAPKKGSELREDIKNESLKAYNTAKNMTKKDAQELLNQTIDTIKKSVDEFDVEEFKEMAINKFNELANPENPEKSENTDFEKPNFKVAAQDYLKDNEKETIK